MRHQSEVADQEMEHRYKNQSGYERFWSFRQFLALGNPNGASPETLVLQKNNFKLTGNSIAAVMCTS
eukprot:Awhi_evm1s2732